MSTYLNAYPGFYFTGDGCRRDSDGYYWIQGRVGKNHLKYFIAR
jgi:acetyl-CoA synthetase